MPVITLSDGSQYRFNNPISTLDVAYNINSNLAKTCIAGLVNGNLIEAIHLIEKDSKLFIITAKDKKGLEIIRHSCAHLLGQAIKQLWPCAKMEKLWPDKNTAIELISDDKDFYYNIDLDYSLTQKDLIILEKRMHDLIDKKFDIIRKKVSCQTARDIFISRCETYKVSNIDKIIDNSDVLELIYYEEYVDICQGLHVPNIQLCYHFKLQKISDVFYHDHEKTKKLQRIYGIILGSKKQLIDYLKHLEQLEKHDHRKIGKQLDLYHTQEEAPGMVFWHNDGWIIFQELEFFIRTKLKLFQYQEVKGPCIMDKILWEKTGHWDNYSGNMFTTSSENREYCIKPMNCPGHIQIFNQSIKSYRDLPIRIAELGSCHRNEPSGALHGLMRLREFTQDDAHIFCTEDQVYNEVNNCIKMIYDIYGTFGFKNILVKLSSRPENRIGNDETWEKAENDLSILLQNNHIDFECQPGEGAFYGPKIEFSLLDCLNRSWQCGTVQLDFSLPGRLGAFYIGKNNKRIVPVMIHRAILGSIERFIGILTEEYSGFYPTWLAPIQVVLINITHNQLEYVTKIKEKFLAENIRIKLDSRNETINFKIREHTIRRIPYILICGNIEMTTGKISVRTRRGKNLGSVDVYEFIDKLKNEIHSYSLNQLEE